MKVYRYKTLEVRMTELSVEPTDKFNRKRRVYRLTDSFLFSLFHEGGRQELLVPKGFETDFASMPKWAEKIVGHESLRPASVLHDWASVNKLPPFYAHALLRSAMLALGAGPWQQRVVFWSVMLAGQGGPFYWITKKLGVGVGSK